MALTKLAIPGPTSGSIGGVTFSRNRGGAYMRVRATPTNPNTPLQQAVRSIMAGLASVWITGLTALQRQAWDAYAFNVPLPNALGDPVNVGGIGMFMRSNVGRVAAGLGPVFAAPTIFNLGEMSNPVIGVVDAPASTMSLGFTETDDWVSETDSSMLVYASRSQNPSVNFFKGPYQFAQRVDGDTPIPPTSPAVINLLQTPVAGNRTFFRIRVSRADGRLSTEFRGFGLAT